MKRIISAVLVCLMLLCGCVRGGMYTIRTKTDANGDMVKEFFDGENRKIKREYVNSAGEITAKLEYFYDENDRLLKSGYSYEGYSQVTEYDYDERGNNISAIITDSDGYEAVMEYSYDGNDKMVVKTVKNPGGTEFVIEYEYDEEGRLVKERQTSTDNNKLITKYSYDEKGNNVKKETTDLAGYNSSEEMTYDEKGNVISKKETTSYLDGLKTKEELTTYTYDEENNLIKEDYTDFDGNGRIKEYSYTEEKVETIE